ncbi:MAG: RimK family alpha-L-glutamate ligase [Suipraeoptans sp.]
MLKGWLIINEFWSSPKVKALSERLIISASEMGHELKKMTNSEVLSKISLNENGIIQIKGVNYPDFVLFWDKDVGLARLLEEMKIPLFNSSKSIEICDSKARTIIELANCSIKMPQTMIGPLRYVSENHIGTEFLEEAIDSLNFPFVAKECFGSFGEQVYLINNMDKAIWFSKFIKNRPFIFQEYIKSSNGKDLRIYMVGNEPIASIIRINNQDFRANYGKYAKANKYKPSKQQIEMAVKASKKLGIDFGGIDILFGEDDEPIFCEANSNAHFSKLEQTTNTNVAGAILKHIIKKVM